MLALVLLGSLVMAGVGQYVGRRAWHNHYLAALVAGSAFAATFGVLLNILNNFQLSG